MKAELIVDLDARARQMRNGALTQFRIRLRWLPLNLLSRDHTAGCGGGGVSIPDVG